MAAFIGSWGGWLLLGALWLLPPLLSAHEPPRALPSPSAGSTATEVGLQPRLGAHIPLDLTFLDENGQTVTLAQLIRRPTLILPVYYGCTNVCNFLQGGLARSLPQVQLTPGEDFQVLSVSMDETETPELAAKYQKMYLTSMNQAFPAQGWHFLTGEREQILALTEAAGYHFQRQGKDFLHPVVSFVVTADGKIVRYLYGTSFLAKDLTLAFLEGAQGRVGATIRQVVAFCFSYDPQNKTYVFNLLRVAATVVILTAAGLLAFLLLTGKRQSKPPRDR